MEKKLLSASQVKMSDTGNGGISCYPNAFWNVDSYGDIVLRGAYAETRDFFLQRGFMAHSHDWSYLGLIGFPNNLTEDDYGPFADFSFHSDEVSQSVRTKVKERMEARKDVLFSIGFEIVEKEVIYPRDYETRLKEVLPFDRLSAALESAKAFPKIRLIKKLKLYECSLVTAPANEDAVATAVKNAIDNGKPDNGAKDSTMTLELKGTYLGEYAEAGACMNAIYSLNSRLMYGPLYDCLYDGEMTMEQLGAAFDEFRDLSLKVCHAMMEGTESEVETYAKAIKELWVDPQTLALADGAHDLKFQPHLKAVESAVLEVLARYEKRQEFRAAEGRKPSAATVEVLRGLKNRIDALLPSALPDGTNESGDAEKSADAATTEAKADAQEPLSLSVLAESLSAEAELEFLTLG